MSLHIYTHPACLGHELWSLKLGRSPVWAPFEERAGRLNALHAVFNRMALAPVIPAPATRAQVERVHRPDYVDHIERRSQQGLVASILSTIRNRGMVQWYTRVSPGSYDAAMHAAGTVVAAVEDTLSGKCRRAFCAVRPPGHHAGPERGEGFCLFNNIAIGAYHALAQGAGRVAIIDFDRHHGNGTQEIIRTHPTPQVFFASSYQEGCKYAKEAGSSSANHLMKTFPIGGGSLYAEVEREYRTRVIPALQDFGPDLVMISAGFDMHKSDPLTSIRMESEDYFDLTRMLVDVADKTAHGRVVSVLEGGYNEAALSACVGHHLRALAL